MTVICRRKVHKPVLQVRYSMGAGGGGGKSPIFTISSSWLPSNF